MTSATAVFMLCILYVAGINGEWGNKYDQPAYLECGHNKLFSFIASVNDNRYQDRRWQYECKRSPSSFSTCSMSGYVNEFEKPVAFNCPGEDVVNSMYSYHNDDYEDRRFEFRCCGLSQKSTRNCQYTEYINELDGDMNYTVPEGRYIKGFSSVHDLDKKDRRWKIYLCDLL